MTQQNHPLLVQSFADKLCDFDAVLRHAVDSHAAPSSVIPAKGFASAALVPLDDGEILLPGAKRESERYVGGTRAAVQHQHDRVVAILAPELDPLVNASYPDEHALLDSVRHVDSKRSGVSILTNRAICQPADKGD